MSLPVAGRRPAPMAGPRGVVAVPADARERDRRHRAGVVDRLASGSDAGYGPAVERPPRLPGAARRPPRSATGRRGRPTAGRGRSAAAGRLPCSRRWPRAGRPTRTSARRRGVRPAARHAAPASSRSAKRPSMSLCAGSPPQPRALVRDPPVPAHDAVVGDGVVVLDGQWPFLHCSCLPATVPSPLDEPGATDQHGHRAGQMLRIRPIDHHAARQHAERPIPSRSRSPRCRPRPASTASGSRRRRPPRRRRPRRAARRAPPRRSPPSRCVRVVSFSRSTRVNNLSMRATPLTLLVASSMPGTVPPAPGILSRRQAPLGRPPLLAPLHQLMQRILDTALDRHVRALRFAVVRGHVPVLSDRAPSAPLPIRAPHGRRHDGSRCCPGPPRHFLRSTSTTCPGAIRRTPSNRRRPQFLATVWPRVAPEPPRETPRAVLEYVGEATRAPHPTACLGLRHVSPL